MPSSRSSPSTGETLQVVLLVQPLVLLWPWHARAHHFSLCRNSEGPLPDPGHRHHPGRFRGRPIRFLQPPCRERQQALAKVILQDPAVESLSSFIGVDGTNTTLNTGRIQINLKPLESGRPNATDVILRLQSALARVSGITLYMQPVQDLTMSDRVSRTQYQYTLEDPSPDELNTWAPQMLAKLQALPQLRDAASDQLTSGLSTTLDLDRDTASRLGLTTSTIDNTLYDAFGQRQVSTLFTAGEPVPCHSRGESRVPAKSIRT
jgi:multidrug efflux pump subunit AcrB